jgi:hypothetical protein
MNSKRATEGVAVGKEHPGTRKMFDRKKLL